MKKMIMFAAVCFSILVGGYAVAGPINQCPVGTKIDDGKACTLDECTMLRGRPKVTHALACPAGAVCNAKGACEKIDPNAACKGINTEDGKACTMGTCKVVNGKPVVTQKEACSEGNTCNAHGNCEAPDKCADNPDVDDGKECTVDTCDPDTGAVWHASNCAENMECTGNGCQPMKCHPDYDYIEEVPEECIKDLASYQKKPTYACVYKYSTVPENPYENLCPAGSTYSSFSHAAYTCTLNANTELSFENLLEQVTCAENYLKYGNNGSGANAKYISCYKPPKTKDIICGVGGEVAGSHVKNKPMWCCY